MRRLVPLYSLFLLIFGYLACVLADVAYNTNPYHILGVAETASQEEIKRQYRALCLKYHPDKNTKRSLSERRSVETKFKQLQEAYSQIGTAEGRRNWNLRQSSPFASSSSAFASTPQGQNPYPNFNQYEDDLFAQAYRSYMSRRPTHRFYTTRAFGPTNHEGFADGAMAWIPSSWKSVYEQRVPVSLYDLYNGKSNVKFRLSHHPNNIWTHCWAAFRGGIAYAILYQSFLFVIPLWRMTNRWIALSTALGLFYKQLPKTVDETDRYEATLQAGYKAGTRFTFQSDDPRIQVVFILEEEKHPTFRRVGDDLHADITLSLNEAKNGCTISMETLSAHESSIEIVLEPDGIRQTGQTLVIKGQGWPRRKTKTFGDLVVHFTLVKSKRKKPRVWRSRSK